jgi:hypothetical protein
MRFKSKAQRRKFAELLVKGEITPDAYERWNRDTGRAELPERAQKKAKRRKTKPKPKSKARSKVRPRKPRAKSKARSKRVPRRRQAS